MLIDMVFTLIFILGVYYLIRYRNNVKNAVLLTKQADFPKGEKEMKSVLIPPEWKEMRPLSNSTKSYLYVKWGTVAAVVLLLILLVTVLTTDLFGSSLFTIAYLFFIIIRSVQHPGNLYILPNGIILHGKYFPYNKVQKYEVERIVRWHQLYGLNDRVNFGYKLIIQVKGIFPDNHFLVIEDQENLEKIIGLLEKKGVPGIRKQHTSAK
ncbi:hypothetical protein ACLM5H_17185 [Fredinandcohnia humi]